jgi:hypothetical protein
MPGEDHGSESESAKGCRAHVSSSYNAGILSNSAVSL